MAVYILEMNVQKLYYNDPITVYYSNTVKGHISSMIFVRAIALKSANLKRFPLRIATE